MYVCVSDFMITYNTCVPSEQTHNRYQYMYHYNCNAMLHHNLNKSLHLYTEMDDKVLQWIQRVLQVYMYNTFTHKSAPEEVGSVISATIFCVYRIFEIVRWGITLKEGSNTEWWPSTLNTHFFVVTNCC